MAKKGNPLGSPNRKRGKLLIRYSDQVQSQNPPLSTRSRGGILAVLSRGVRYLPAMALTMDEISIISPDPSTPLTKEEIYEVWLHCHQVMRRIRNYDEAAALGDPQARMQNIPEWFSDHQSDLMGYILSRESMRAMGGFQTQVE